MNKEKAYENKIQIFVIQISILLLIAAPYIRVPNFMTAFKIKNNVSIIKIQSIILYNNLVE